MKNYYITFRSVTIAQRGERLLEGAGISCSLQRTPRWMEEQGCGYALRIWTEDIAAVLELLRKNQILMKRLYKATQGGHLEEMHL